MKLRVLAVFAFTLAAVAIAAGVTYWAVEVRDSDGAGPPPEAVDTSGPAVPAPSGTAGAPAEDAATTESPPEAGSPPAGETAADPAIAGARHLYDYAERYPSSDESAALAEGYEPFCETLEEVQEGWLMRCGLRHPDGRSFPRLFDLVVGQDGSVQVAPES